MILVTAAYGNQGRALIPRLAAAGARVRALRATPGREEELRALGAEEVLIGDQADPAVLRAAMAGVSSVYHIGPTAHPQEREMGFAVIEAAQDCGVGHLVYSSVLHAIVSELLQHKAKRDVEERLVSSRLNFTIFQPSDYMQILRYRRAFETGEFALAWSVDRRQSVIDVNDIAEVAAKVLLEGEPHFGATYELSAPGCFTGHDIAAMIARICGREVTAVEVAPEARVRDILGADQPEAGAAYRLRLFEALKNWYSAHDFVGNPNVLTWLLGRPPTRLEEFLRAEYEKS